MLSTLKGDTLPTIQRNPEIVGRSWPTGVISIVWSNKHRKYSIRMINGDNEPQYIGFITQHDTLPHLWYTYTKVGNKVALNVDLHKVIDNLRKNILEAVELVWVYTRTDNSMNWEIYYVG